MNSGTLITIVVVVVVVLIVLALIVFLGRDRIRETDSRPATDLPEKARGDELPERDGGTTTDQVDPSAKIGRHDIRATEHPNVIRDDDGSDAAGPRH